MVWASEQLHAALGIVLTLLVVVACLAARTWWRSYRARRGGKRAHRREVSARALLESAGFEVEGEQVRHAWSVKCGDRMLTIDLRADYLVRRDERRFVADVKTGPRATQITTAATRRQLLEYRVAYEVSGVLLVDMESQRIHEVVFAFDHPLS